MINYAKLALSDVTNALNAGTAVSLMTIPAGKSLKSVCLDNGFNVDMVVVIDGFQPVYLRAATYKIVDLGADQEAVQAPSADRVLKVFAAAGVAPTDDGSGNYPNTFVADCAF